MVNIILGFPTIGKTTVCQKDSKHFADIDYGSYKTRPLSEYYSDIELALSKGQVVMTNNPDVMDSGNNYDVAVFIPNYGVDEAVKRVLGRDGDHSFADELRENYSAWVSDWENRACTLQKRVLECFTAENGISILSGLRLLPMWGGCIDLDQVGSV